MNGTAQVTKYRYEVDLSAILFLSAFLDFWNVWKQVFSNACYAAAIRSMLANPSVLFFNSYDTAGFVTVDNPPVGLWVQGSCTTIPSSEWGGTTSTFGEYPGSQAINGTGNRTLPGLQNCVTGPSGITHSLAGNQNSLYDCTGYKGQTVA
jgi:hypothetical protein